MVDLSQIPATEKDLTLKSNSKFKVAGFFSSVLINTISHQADSTESWYKVGKITLQISPQLRWRVEGTKVSPAKSRQRLDVRVLGDKDGIWPSVCMEDWAWHNVCLLLVHLVNIYWAPDKCRALL